MEIPIGVSLSKKAGMGFRKMTTMTMNHMTHVSLLVNVLEAAV